MFGSELGIKSAPLTTWSEHTFTDPPRNNKNEEKTLIIFILLMKFKKNARWHSTMKQLQKQYFILQFNRW